MAVLVSSACSGSVQIVALHNLILNYKFDIFWLSATSDEVINENGMLGCRCKGCKWAKGIAQPQGLKQMSPRARWPGFSTGWVWLLCLPDGGRTCSLSFMLLVHNGNHICLIGMVVTRIGIMSIYRTRLYTDAIRFVHTAKIVKSFDSSWRFVYMATNWGETECLAVETSCLGEIAS